MLFSRPDRDDLRIIGHYTGKVVFGLGLLQLVPAVLALLLREWNALTAFVLGASLAIIAGRLSEIRLFTREPLQWSHGMVTVALSWLVGTMFCAVPLYLSGHFGSFVDAYFDAMSGLTTTGLTVLQDLDHLAASVNFYRHLMHFAGGQGIIIVVLTLFAASGSAQLGTLYVGEGRDERIMPNIIRTARFIYTVAAAYLVVGTAALFVTGMVAGLTPWRAIYHAVNLFMAAFDTGGFSTMSSSVGYYHSASVEAVLIVLMVAGTLSFGLHHMLWRGNPREFLRNIETRTMLLTLTGATALLMVGLARSGAFTDAGPLLRKGFFTIVSAHLNTGFTVNSPALFVSDWGQLAPAAMVGAMALGGMASSTAGGFKAIRVGMAMKGLVHDIRRVLLPESALVVSTYHSRRRTILRDSQVKAATTMLLLFVLTFLAGAMVTLYTTSTDFTSALFESVSATSNAGISVGVTSPDMNLLAQLTIIVQMWVGRLEFMAVFALIGYGVAALRGRQ